MQAMKIDKNNHAVYLSLANLYVEINSLEKAIENFEIAKKLNPLLDVDKKIKICKKYLQH